MCYYKFYLDLVCSHIAYELIGLAGSQHAVTIERRVLEFVGYTARYQKTTFSSKTVKQSKIGTFLELNFYIGPLMNV